MNPEAPPTGDRREDEPKNDTAPVEEKRAAPPASEQGSERRRFLRYRLSMPVWLSYGRNYREVESGQVRDFSKSGLFLVTEGGQDLQVGDVVRVNATFTVRGEARVVRVDDMEGGSRGVALEFSQKLEVDI